MPLINEFAIEPGALSSWQDFRYVFDKLGFSEGRLGVRAPDDWCMRILKACSDEIDKKRIELQLRKFVDSRLVPAPNLDGAIYSNWDSLIQAIHSRRNLAGVIVAGGRSWHVDRPPGTSIDTLTNEFMEVETDDEINGTAHQLAEVARPLIRLSAHLFIIDPFFNLQYRSFRATLSEFLRVCSEEGCSAATVIASGEKQTSTCVKRCQYVEKMLRGRAGRPIQIEFKFVVPPWPDGLFHHRFVLSEIGAIRYDSGLEARGRRTKVDVMLVEAKRHRELVEQYCSDMRHSGFQIAEQFSWPTGSQGVNLGAQMMEGRN